MAWSFNVFTGNLDLVGSGGGTVVFEGEVETFAELPETVGDPAVGASYLVRSSTGVWLVNKRQSGIWIRRNNTGVRATDWEYGGDYPVNSVNGQTGNVSLTAADVGASATGHTHAASEITSGVFDNARINFAAPDAIGSTTRNTGAFTTLNANNGTLTASAPAFLVEQTLNGTASTVFSLAELKVNSTASSTNSSILRCLDGAITILDVRRNGIIIGSGGMTSSNGFRAIGNGNSGGQVILSSNGHYCWNDSTTSTFGTQDLILRRDAANTLAQSNGLNAQTFNIYNTFTSSTNHERGFLRWSSNVFQIGTEKAGTGSARNLELQTDGTTRVRIQAEGIVTSGTLFLSNSYIDGQGDSNASIRLSPFATGHVIITTGLLRMHGSSASFPALKRNSTTLEVRLANDSGFAPLSCGALTLNGNLDASTRDLVTDTTTGTKIGTGTTQKIGFFNATPVVQQAAVADATDAASTQDRLNDLLARLRTLGLIAT